MYPVSFHELLFKSNTPNMKRSIMSMSRCIHMTGRLHRNGMHKHDLFNSGLFTFHLTGVENAKCIFSASCQTISLLSKSYYNLTTRRAETIPPFEMMRRRPDALNITRKQIHLINFLGCKSTWNKLVPSCAYPVFFLWIKKCLISRLDVFKKNISLML